MWKLIVVLGGLTGVNDVEFHDMPKDQCVSSMKQLLPLNKYIGLACVGPNGEQVTVEDIK